MTPMRQLATLASEDQARTFADYLLTLRIETRLDPEPGGWAVWVCDEDRVAQARAELEQFTGNPSDPRYTRAGREAEAVRRQEEQAERAYARRQVAMRDRFRDEASVWRRPVTTALMAACVVVTLLTGFGKDMGSPVYRALVMEPLFSTPEGWMYLKGLPHIRHGEVWRLVTPIFLHFTLLHLLFNVLMLNSLGGVVEARRGPLRYLLFVLVVAACSNLGEYYAGPHWAPDGGLKWGSGSGFGGMSGVNYGLFGYIWMKARWEPASGFVMPPSTVFIMIAWYVVCFFPGMPVANMCHTVGLVLGSLIGAAPHLWRSLRGRA
jgi:GlpG protein